MFSPDPPHEGVTREWRGEGRVPSAFANIADVADFEGIRSSVREFARVVIERA